MQEFFTSPVIVAAAAGLFFLVGWLVRQWSLERGHLAQRAILERDRDYARTEAQKLSDQVGLLEADLKKSAFDASQTFEKVSGLQLEKSGLSDALHQAAVREAKMLADRSEFVSKTTALEEQVLGLRAKSAELASANQRLQEHEEAQKRLRADCGTALVQLGETRSALAANEKKRAEEAADFEKMRGELASEIERLQAEIVRLRARPNLLPTILPAHQNGKNGQNGHENGQNGYKNGQKNGSKDGGALLNGSKKTARKSLISSETAASLAPFFGENEDFADDLKLINGIGPREEKALAALGIATVERLAAMTDGEIAELSEGSENLMRKLQKEGWQAQAKHLRANLSVAAL